MKICQTCKRGKDLGSFGFLKKAEDNLYPICKECVKGFTKKTTEYRKIYNKKYREINKEILVKEKKRWFKKDREKNPDKYREREKEWCLKNPEKRLAKEAKHRATKLNATPKWLTKDDLSEIQQYYRLRRSREIFEGIQFHVDHIIPLQGKTVCGLHVPWNLRVIPAIENQNKSNKLIHVGN